MWYAETTGMRRRQVVRDLLVLVWMVLWGVVGMQLHDVVSVLAVPGRELTDVGTSLGTGADRIADALDDTPLIGGGIAAPFTALGDAAGELVIAGQATERAAGRLALWLSILVAAPPILVVALPYGLWRWSGARRARATAALRDEPGMLRVLALRAVLTRPLEELRRVSQDPLRDAQERPEALAALELHDLGLRSRRPDR